MKRYMQTSEEIASSLSDLIAGWEDDHFRKVKWTLEFLQFQSRPPVEIILELLETDFDSGMTIIRLILEFSKDEFKVKLKDLLGDGGVGVTRFRSDRESFVSAILKAGFSEKSNELLSAKITWQDLLLERLKYGRGSAIKGQTRARDLENLVEDAIRVVFIQQYDVRCSFTGPGGEEKTDFAIPSKEHPRILIEVKAYGATGSKQTDIIGDIGKIIRVKRSDTNLLLVTDGITWKERMSDLKKLVQYQNAGDITRIYTKSMISDLSSDLKQLKLDHQL